MQDGLYVRGDNTRVYFFERGASSPPSLCFSRARAGADEGPERAQTSCSTSLAACGAAVRRPPLPRPTSAARQAQQTQRRRPRRRRRRSRSSPRASSSRRAPSPRSTLRPRPLAPRRPPTPHPTLSRRHLHPHPRPPRSPSSAASRSRPSASSSSSSASTAACSSIASASSRCSACGCRAGGGSRSRRRRRMRERRFVREVRRSSSSECKDALALALDDTHRERQTQRVHVQATGSNASSLPEIPPARRFCLALAPQLLPRHLPSPPLVPSRPQQLPPLANLPRAPPPARPP